MSNQLILSFAGGIVGGIIVLMVYILSNTMFAQERLSKDFMWEEILQNVGFSQKQLQKMYLASLTFGECATGELLGSLNRLQKELPEGDYQEYLELHIEFGASIAMMYALRNHQDLIEFAEYRIQALAVFRKMQEFKAEHELEYVNPFPKKEETMSKEMMLATYNMFLF